MNEEYLKFSESDELKLNAYQKDRIHYDTLYHNFYYSLLNKYAKYKIGETLYDLPTGEELGVICKQLQTKNQLLYYIKLINSDKIECILHFSYNYGSKKDLIYYVKDSQ